MCIDTIFPTTFARDLTSKKIPDLRSFEIIVEKETIKSLMRFFAIRTRSFRKSQFSPSQEVLPTDIFLQQEEDLDLRFL